MRTLGSADRVNLYQWEQTGGWSHPNCLVVLGPAKPRPIPMDSAKGGLEGMLIAGAGPACAAVFSNPFDVAKVRMQLQGEASSGGKKAFSNVWECLYKTGTNEGIRGLQKGLSASIVREGSKNFFRIGLFHPVLDVLHDRSVHSTSPPIWKRLVAGSASGTAGAVICNPIEIVKTRLQAASLQKSAVGYQGYHYRGFADAFRVIVKSEGVKALWTGTGVSTVRSILSTGANMTVNSSLKEMALEDPRWSWMGFKPGPLTDAVCSLISAFFAVAANNPADVVRTRLYNQPFEMSDGQRKGLYYTGGVDCLQKVLKTEGPMALMKGFSGHFMRTGPHYVVAFIIMGIMERALHSWSVTKGETDWIKERDLAFDQFCEAEVNGWTRASLEKALRVALPRDALRLNKHEYEAMIRKDAGEIASSAATGTKGFLDRPEFFLSVAPVMDRVIVDRIRVFGTNHTSDTVTPLSQKTRER